MARIRITDNELSCFGTNYIGIRGKCNETDAPDSGLYIDDLPAINLTNASKASDTETNKGITLLERCIDLAIRLTTQDFMGMLTKQDMGLRFNSVLFDDSVRMAGTYEYTTKEAKRYAVLIENYNTQNEFETMRIFDFAFVSGDAVLNKEFKVETSKGGSETANFDIVVGYNKLDIIVDASVEWVRISWDASDMAVGRKDEVHFFGIDCVRGYCKTRPVDGVLVDLQESEDAGVTWTTSGARIGFDLNVQLKCNEFALACYFRKDLALPIVYMAGIQFFLNVMGTDRVNEYTENSEKTIEKLLLQWYGGLDMTTGIKHSARYWSLLKAATSKVQLGIKNADTRCFSCVGNRITNSLPK